jgi:NAD(P)-dependent dehydrogenase (short-subunit alcohol dehydrogenase family)
VSIVCVGSCSCLADTVSSEEGRVEHCGAIVNCASVNSRMCTPGSIAYTTSKHAVDGITKTVSTLSVSHMRLSVRLSCPKAALEAREHGIRVNSVSPGFVLTGMVAPLMKENPSVKDLWKGCEARQGRSATADEVGDVVVLLASPRMSLVNGVNLMIDGGFTINAGFS